MEFIDTHTHILPFIDDGSKSWEESLEMLKLAEQDGIRQLVCTPHVLSPNDFLKEKEIFALFHELQKRARDAGITIDLFLGAEIHIQPDLQLHRPIATLAQNGRYFLVEFPMNMIPDFVAERFFKIIVSGKTPVIAHPERNGRVIQNLQIAYDFAARGALLQLDAGSLFGVFGEAVRKTAELLLDADLIHLVGSDAHDKEYRSPKLSSAYNRVAERWGPMRAATLFNETPHKVLSGEAVTIPTPVPLEQLCSERIQKKSTLKRWFKRMVQLG
ncbi:hypothetical protein JW992_12710 [candidate division KSB1 bacterium]|nr:hypothetical protein [candidate division KSB1 bacterium]